MPQRAAETVGWMMRDMTAAAVDGQAAFAASEDADSEGEEGRFYVWTEAEIDALLGPDAPAFKRAYDVTAERQLGRPHHPAPRHPARLARRGSRPGPRAGHPVPRPRETRPPRPGRQGARRLERPGHRRPGARRGRCSASPHGWPAPREAFDFILTHMTARHGGVEHAWRLGRVTAPGLIEDQAAMARAALALYEATGEATYLADAERLANAAQAASPTATAASTPPPPMRRTCRWPGRAPPRTTPPPPATA